MAETEDDLKETLERILRAIIRRRWWIILPTFFASFAAICVISRLPNRYRSVATISVHQAVSQKYVDPAPTMTVVDAVNSLAREVLSRARLIAIIDDFGLYAKEKHDLAPQELSELMRQNVDVDPIDYSAFHISFTSENPLLAQQVTSRLAALFIGENVKNREGQAQSAATFLTEQLAVSKRKLADQEERLTDFKTRYIGELPEQQPMNAAALAEARMQLQNVMARLNRENEQRLSLEASLNGILLRLRSERTHLLIRFTAKHPEVRQKDLEIAKMESLSDLMRTRTPGQQTTQNMTTPEDPAVASLKSQVESNSRAIANLSAEEARLRTEMVQYQGRLNLSPVREQQLAGILRDYELFKQDYTSLLNKQLQSQLATKLEESQGGQQFRLVEEPTLPVLPSSPKRLKLTLQGVAASLLAGLVLGFLRDRLDRSFHDQTAVSEQCEFSLIVSIPLLLTPTEQRVRFWKGTFEWLAGILLILSVLTARIYLYQRP